MEVLGERTIKNFDALATSPERQTLLLLAEAGFAAIQTETVVRNNVSLVGNVLHVQGLTFDLSEFENLYVLGVGKCAGDAARELETILGDRISDGVILDVRPTEGLTTIKARVGTHPYPSEENVQYTREMLDLAERAGEHDLVLAIISGGGSALLCQPETHTVSDEMHLIKHLFKKGATIQELNTVRKHLSRARGGHLAAAVHPGTLVTLVFSDVPGDDLHTISSGPTILDLSTRGDALAVFEHHEGAKSGFDTEHFFDTPKDLELFKRVHNQLILTNKTALEAMKARAVELGYAGTIVSTRMQGEARDVAKQIVSRLHNEPARSVLLYGGETTVTITGPGKGGRNEELAAAAVSLLYEDELLTSLASDGRDNTEYAGGIADKLTREKLDLQGLRAEDFLFTNDTFSLFHTLRQGIETGYTGANVADLVIAIKHGVE
jgi:glycerate-2-kinase